MLPYCMIEDLIYFLYRTKTKSHQYVRHYFDAKKDDVPMENHVDSFKPSSSSSSSLAGWIVLFDNIESPLNFCMNFLLAKTLPIAFRILDKSLHFFSNGCISQAKSTTEKNSIVLHSERINYTGCCLNVFLFNIGKHC